MATERTYIIPLRKEWLKVPKHKRAKKAVTGIKDFLKKHMKSENIKIGRNLNLKIWEKGIKNPPHKIKITAVKEDDGTVKVELFGNKYEEVKIETKKKEKSKKEELMEKITGKKEEKKEKTAEKPKPKKEKKETLIEEPKEEKH